MRFTGFLLLWYAASTAGATEVDPLAETQHHSTGVLDTVWSAMTSGSTTGSSGAVDGSVESKTAFTAESLDDSFGDTTDVDGLDAGDGYGFLDAQGADLFDEFGSNPFDPETDHRELRNRCNPSKVVAHENFENGKFAGWRNGRIDHASGFTKFLGRYGKRDHGKFPAKTFSVPKNAKNVIFNFDFYEIDSWDKKDKDYLCVVIDGKMVDIGTFDRRHNENGRSATRHGVYFKINSQSPPRSIGFNRKWKDQIHHVTMRIPNRFFKSDGKLKIEFQARVNQPNINDESAGFDNIKLTAEFNCRRRLRGVNELVEYDEEDAMVISADPDDEASKLLDDEHEDGIAETDEE